MNFHVKARLKLVSLLIVGLFMLISAGTFSSNTDIVITDTEGNSYDIDSILDAGIHIVVFQTIYG